MLAKLRALAHHIRVAIITEDPHNDATSRLDRMDGVTNIDGVKLFAITKEQAPGVITSTQDPVVAGVVT